MKYSTQELDALIGEVEGAFASHLKKAETEKEQKLSKTEKSTQEEASEAKTKETATAKVAKSEEEAKEVEEQSFDYDDEDIKEMNEMYTSMNKSEQAAHYKSLKQALFTEEEESEEEVAPKVAKSEDTESDNEVADLQKAEIVAKDAEISDLKEENEKIQKSFSNLLGKLGKFVKKSSTAPKQKAITKIEYIKKSEDESTATKKPKEEDVTKLSKIEVTKRLNLQARSSEIKKSDREAINNFYLTDKRDIESIRHLL